ncbi:MAG: AMP-binding protein, partial [Alicyclobacillaceae bacterium]|nr:AMP-binding protein [Alicyclobacillaceae bacterium]
MVPSPEERRRLLETRFPTWPRRTLGSHFRERCQEFAERPFLMTAEGVSTYRDTWEQSWKIAKALLALGVQRRDHIAILMVNEPNYVYLKLAVALVGAVAVPLNTLLREEELDYMLRQSDSKWLFMHQTAAGNRHESAVARLVERMGQEKERTLKQVVCVQNSPDPVNPKFLPWDSFIGLSAQVSDAALEERIKQSEYPDEVSDIIYTSGTTGLPKGVMLTHDMFLRCAYSTTLS